MTEPKTVKGTSFKQDLDLDMEAREEFIAQTRISIAACLKRLLNASDLSHPDKDANEEQQFEWKRELHNEVDNFANLLSESMTQDRSNQRVNGMRVSSNFLNAWTNPDNVPSKSVPKAE